MGPTGEPPYDRCRDGADNDARSSPGIRCPACGQRVPLASGTGPPGGKRFECERCQTVFGAGRQ